MEELYVEQGLSTCEIAERFGCVQSTVGVWLKKHGIEVRSQEAPSEVDDPDVLRRLYEEQGSIRGVARELGTNHHTIADRMEKHGIEQNYNYTEAEELADEAWLYEEYVENGRTLRDIADELDCEKSGVGKALKRHDIEARVGKPPGCDPDASRDELYEKYVEENRGTVGIGDDYDVSHTAILNWLRYYNIPVREPGAKATGEEHHLWEGGYRSYAGPNWPEQRVKALERDNYSCVVCGKTSEEQRRDTGRGLDVHHITKRREFVDVEGEDVDWADADVDWGRVNALDNLISLCHDHHSQWEGIPLRPDNGE